MAAASCEQCYFLTALAAAFFALAGAAFTGALVAVTWVAANAIFFAVAVLRLARVLLDLATVTPVVRGLRRFARLVVMFLGLAKASALSAKFLIRSTSPCCAVVRRTTDNTTWCPAHEVLIPYSAPLSPYLRRWTTSPPQCTWPIRRSSDNGVAKGSALDLATHRSIVGPHQVERSLDHLSRST